MFTCESLHSFADKAKASLEEYAKLTPEALDLCISEGNKKIGRVWNVSLLPIFTCRNCTECKKYCYDIKACLQYKNVLKARSRNTSILLRDKEAFWRKLRGRMEQKRTRKYFRFHVGGEIMNLEYFEEMVRTAQMFPDWTIWTYTKMYSIVNEYVRSHGGNRETAIPANLSIMFSEWKGMPMDNPYGFPTFRCVFRDTESAPAGVWKCPGNCEACLEAHRGCPYGESSWVWDH